MKLPRMQIAGHIYPELADIPFVDEIITTDMVSNSTRRILKCLLDENVLSREQLEIIIKNRALSRADEGFKRHTVHGVRIDDPECFPVLLAFSIVHEDGFNPDEVAQMDFSPFKSIDHFTARYFRKEMVEKYLVQLVTEKLDVSGGEFTRKARKKATNMQDQTKWTYN